MDYNVFITELAQSDLDETISYISNTLSNPKAAQKLLDLFLTEIEFLKSSPLMCPICTDPILQKKGYRKLIIKNYIALYKVEHSTKSIYIMRIVYAKRDYSKLV